MMMSWGYGVESTLGRPNTRHPRLCDAGKGNFKGPHEASLQPPRPSLMFTQQPEQPAAHVPHDLRVSAGTTMTPPVGSQRPEVLSSQSWLLDIWLPQSLSITHPQEEKEGRKRWRQADRQNYTHTNTNTPASTLARRHPGPEDLAGVCRKIADSSS